MLSNKKVKQCSCDSVFGGETVFQWNPQLMQLSGTPHNLPLAEIFKSCQLVNWKGESGNNSHITALARG